MVTRIYLRFDMKIKAHLFLSDITIISLHTTDSNNR